MTRGFIGGILMGGAFSIAVAGLVSFVVPLDVPPQISETPPQDMASSDIGTLLIDQPMVDQPDPDIQPDTDSMPSVSGPVTPPAADTAVLLDDAVTNPPAAPLTGQSVATVTPGEVTEPSPPQPTADAPVLPNPMALAPMEPGAQDAATIATEPSAQIAQEIVEAIDEADATDPAANPEKAPAPAQSAPAISAANTAPEAPAAPSVAQITEMPGPEPKMAPKTLPKPMLSGDVAESRPTIGTPATPPAERDTDVTINRLPTALSPAPSDAPADIVIDTGAADRPITRFSQPFTNPDDKPLMSILLIDQGSDLEGGEVGIAALRSFPYPISFAVDISLPDAAERMRLYREDGFEVMAMVDLPDGAQPSDAETNLAVAFDRLPQVVGVLEGPDGGLQPDRAVADQVTSILAQGGYGLVTQDKGLNTMPKLAVKEGVPAAPIFRDFDSKDQTPTVIRRFLDQAAFKAGLEGSVIMLGRMRPETISALLVWGLQDRASQVALAPISAVLLATDAE